MIAEAPEMAVTPVMMCDATMTQHGGFGGAAGYLPRRTGRGAFHGASKCGELAAEDRSEMDLCVCVGQ